MTHSETGNPVERIGYDVDAARKGSEQQAFVIGFRTEARPDFPLGIGMQDKINAQSRRDRLACVVIRCIADTAETEHDVASREAACERRRNACPFIAKIFDPRQTQAARRQQARQFGEMRIRPLAGEDFVTEDQCTKVHEGSRKG